MPDLAKEPKSNSCHQDYDQATNAIVVKKIIPQKKKRGIEIA
jgi:hypothetical protein